MSAIGRAPVVAEMRSTVARSSIEVTGLRSRADHGRPTRRAGPRSRSKPTLGLEHRRSRGDGRRDRSGQTVDESPSTAYGTRSGFSSDPRTDRSPSRIITATTESGPGRGCSRRRRCRGGCRGSRARPGPAPVPAASPTTNRQHDGDDGGNGTTTRSTWRAGPGAWPRRTKCRPRRVRLRQRPSAATTADGVRSGSNPDEGLVSGQASLNDGVELARNPARSCRMLAGRPWFAERRAARTPARPASGRTARRTTADRAPARRPGGVVGRQAPGQRRCHLEVGDLGLAGSGDQHVLRVQPQVREPLGVRGGDHPGHIEDDRCRASWLVRTECAQRGCEGVPFRPTTTTNAKPPSWAASSTRASLLSERRPARPAATSMASARGSSAGSARMATGRASTSSCARQRSPDPVSVVSARTRSNR